MKKVALYIVLSLGALLTSFPFFWMLGTSLKTIPEALTPTLDLMPSHAQWSNYPDAFRAAPFGTYFYNTFVVSFSVTAAVVLTSLMAGYAFARLTFRGNGLLFSLLLATMMIPFEVTLIPNFILISRLGWYDRYPALIVPWCASAFSIFLARQAFRGLPGDYFDAAEMDGCGHLRFLVWVGVPLVKPALFTVALFAFLGSYNALLWPLVATGSEDMRVVQVGLTVFSGEAGIRLNLLMAASAIVMLPTVALYFGAQRNFVESTLGTGLKS